MTSQQEHDPLSVSTVNIKLPSFWTSHPEPWFIQVESQFAAPRITANLTKYHHVMSSLPPATECEIRDLLFTPPAEDAYKTLKETLIRRVTPSEPQKFQQLLRKTEFGDRTPSHLLRQMKLLGTRTTDLDSIMLRELFLQRRLTNVRMLLISAGETNLSNLAELADRLIMAPCKRCRLVLTRFQDIRDEISRLAVTVAAPQDRLRREHTPYQTAGSIYAGHEQTPVAHAS
ncbi:hypothetical protein HPB47_026831 [Ixodes persulcatus]|uniref:Uncharacterized protein n=1 Tax=Ixodes persulcatus TaxID=34615 RepID=A0AC60PZ67_IXOPE|nr:hypothetical protein HPB47_026831 [Ixodes persulcatus]